MGYVYVLKSKRDGRYYIGSTNNIERRLWQHNNGKVYSTRRMLPVELVCWQKFESLSAARACERQLKKNRRRDLIEKFIDNCKTVYGPIAQLVRAVDS